MHLLAAAPGDGAGRALFGVLDGRLDGYPSNGSTNDQRNKSSKSETDTEPQTGAAKEAAASENSQWPKPNELTRTFSHSLILSSKQLNVSQNQFSETEQRIIETEGNVLAFRFLLERFANRQAPEIRFQVVLTAFQTFGK